MTFESEIQKFDSPFIEMIWRTHHAGGSFISRAEPYWEMIVTKQPDKLYFSIRGPETYASQAPIPENGEFWGIVFKLGVFMPFMPIRKLVNGGIHLPKAKKSSFWLHSSAWEFPTFENADTFIRRLIRDEMLVIDPVVTDILQGRSHDLSLRSVQRRFLHATGLTHSTILQIHRAQKAVALLGQGVSILDVTYEMGYADQPHLTRSLRRYLGQTPAQVLAPKY